jgi:16S rRNA U516 pseudouridylate synthase RsuA-like enzyme
MKEGRKRQIRDTCRQIGLPVVSIIRVRIGSLRLGILKSGQWRHLTPVEVKSLKSPIKPSFIKKPAYKNKTSAPRQGAKRSKPG